MGIQTIPCLFCESKINLVQLTASLVLFSVSMHKMKDNDFRSPHKTFDFFFVPLTIRPGSVKILDPSHCLLGVIKWQMAEMEFEISSKVYSR